MTDIVDQADLLILIQAGLSEQDIRHSILVAQKAVDLAERTGKDLDMVLIKRGALFHDLGKALTHSHLHGELGAEVAERFDLPNDIIEIARKHFHGGVSPEEAEDLGLPIRDYTPNRLEERIVLYADRLVDILTEGYIKTEKDQDAEDRFEEIVTTHRNYGKDKQTSERYVAYHREISQLIQEQATKSGGQSSTGSANRAL